MQTSVGPCGQIGMWFDCSAVDAGFESYCSFYLLFFFCDSIIIRVRVSLLFMRIFSLIQKNRHFNFALSGDA